MLEQVRKAVENGRQKKVEELVRGALEAGAGPGEILDAMEQAMGAVGERFQSGELFIPEVLVAAKTMQKGVEVLRPLLARGDTGKYGKFIIGTARGDLHDIGKNLVALMAESAGFEIVDLGVDVPPERFVEAVPGPSGLPGGGHQRPSDHHHGGHAGNGAGSGGRGSAGTGPDHGGGRAGHRGVRPANRSGRLYRQRRRRRRQGQGTGCLVTGHRRGESYEKST